MKAFLKKNWGNLLFVVLFVLLLVPQTRTPIQVFFQRLISFSPSEISEKEQSHLDSYNWSMEGLNETSKNLNDDKGKVVLINKWATWCPPCVAEMPSLQKLYDTYGERVSFYFITDEAPEKLHKFMSKNDYDFPVYIAKGSAPEKLNSNSLPTTYVIAKDGRIIMEKVGAADWDSEAVHHTLNRLLE